MKNKVRRVDLIKKVAEQSGLTFTQIEMIFDTIVSVIANELSQNISEINFAGIIRIFKTYYPPAPERTATTFNGKTITYKPKPAKNIVKIKPTKKMKDMVHNTPLNE